MHIRLVSGLKVEEGLGRSPGDWIEAGQRSNDLWPCGSQDPSWASTFGLPDATVALRSFCDALLLER
jgi:hypothetical protein